MPGYKGRSECPKGVNPPIFLATLYLKNGDEYMSFLIGKGKGIYCGFGYVNMKCPQKMVYWV